MPDELGQLMAQCEIEAAQEAQARTKEEALRRFGGAEPGPAHRPRRSRALGIAGGVLLLLVGFSFTPPGGAIAEEVGEWIGIGDEPTDSFGTPFGMDAESEDQVIGTGTTPTGVRFELAMNTTEVTEPGRRTPPFTCVYLSFPDRGVASRAASCLTDAALRGFERGKVIETFPYLGPKALGEQSDLIVNVQGTTEVARVEVAYPDNRGEQTVAATLAQFEAAPAQSAKKLAGGAEPRGLTPLVSGVAFLPSTIFRQLPPNEQVPPLQRVPGDPGASLDLKLDYHATSRLLRNIRVTAYDVEGNILAEGDLMKAWTSPIGLASVIPPDR
jgi:hypothetical protein